MTLRRQPRAIENLRLANLQDYIITEDEPDLSPRTTRPTRSCTVPRRVNDDTYEDIMASFRKFSWESPTIDGAALRDYRRFIDAMIIPTRDAVDPLVEWVQEHLGWEKEWILENPVATKREIMRRFEGNDGPELGVFIPQRRFVARETSSPHLRNVSSGESMDRLRQGAESRIGFRDEDQEYRHPSSLGWRLKRIQTPSRPSTRIGFRGDEEMRSSSSMGWRFKKPKMPARPTSALGFSEVGTLKRQLSTLKKKALTNPWQKRTHTPAMKLK